MSDEINVVGIVAHNSKNYIHEVFSAYRNNEVVVPLKDSSLDSEGNFDGLDFVRIVEPGSEGGWLDSADVFDGGEGIAQISFTSGTTGKPKGIVLTHANLRDVVDRLKNVMGLDERISEYIGVPVYHSFGFGRVRSCLAVGGRAYIPHKGFDLLEIANLLGADKINAISMVPTLCRLVLDQDKLIGTLGEKVLWIEIGSQYMSRSEKERMKVLFPNAKIVQHYGLTEASRSSFLDISETSGEALESVGMALGSVEIGISTEGNIKIKGAHVARQKLTDRGLVSLVDEEGWLTTNDRGYLKDGYLYFQGRSDDVINCGGIKIFPEYVEREIRKRTSINKGIAVAKVKDQLRGEGILVAIESHLGEHVLDVKNQVKDVLNNINVQAGTALHFEIVDHLPSTDTGKIKRKILSENFENRQIFNDPISANENDASENLVEIIKGVFNTDDVRPSDSFISLGGDSLSYVVASVAIEKFLGFLPENWESLTFSEIEKIKFQGSDDGSQEGVKKKVVLFIALTVLFLICGELFLQLRSQIKHGRSVFNRAFSESTVVYNENVGAKTYRPLLERYDDTGNIVFSTNSLGLRSPEIDSILRNDELRIAIVGSSTVAFSSNNESMLSQLLQDRLYQVHHGTVSVINGGIEGLDLKSIGKITRGLIFPQNPSAIVIYTGMNNISKLCRDNLSTASQRSALPSLGLPDWALTREMIRKNTTFLTEQKTRNPGLLNPSSIDLSEYGLEYERLVQDIVAEGIEPVLMTNARVYSNVSDNVQSSYLKDALYYYYCFDGDDLIAVGDEFNDQIRRIAQKYDLTLIDLAKEMPGGKKFFESGSHFNENGRHYVADKIFTALKFMN
ncbi:Acyl-CoA synthetase (AMP-forming)/AMP-acid ligase II [Malonomonas rubra DSM 5091]|uniref:Acyl-CoA synthetase (AMP-forming)/AMP-acid ligase II n=1 Tax=Malonomonas rubra DSM 5091 TaxID=1122189 RepID=A0A1M6KDW4_MALRU|nr:AMP-binding protein [Malonomonas rubra]SHJ57165.1 Acyl-CoA synthetase (AMP-forming)/AMP-acid ligase II [Malonomonas rubra DSM 5091]